MTEPVNIEFRINSEQLAAQSQQAVNSVLGIGEASGRTGQSVSNMNSSLSGSASAVQILTEQVNIQKRVIADLERQYTSAKAAFDKVNVGTQNPRQIAERERASKLFREIRAELNGEKQALVELEKELNKQSTAQGRATNSAASYMTQLRHLRNEMQSLRMAGQQETQRYRELQAELTRVGTAYNLVRREQRLLTTAGNANLAGVMAGMSGIAGAFSAGQGIASLFVKNSEKLAEIQTKLQAAMSITMGLQAVSNTLHATSAFRIQTVAKVTELWQGAMRLLNVQLGLSVGLSKALIAGGIGLLIAGIATLISSIGKWGEKQREINRFNAEVNKSTQEQVTKVTALERVLNNSNNSQGVRQNALRELKKIMPSYNAMLDEEGRLIADNTGALKEYIKNIKNTAAAKVASEKAVKAEQEFDDWLSGLNRNEKRAILENSMGALSGDDKLIYGALLERNKKYVNEVNKWNDVLDKSLSDSFKKTTETNKEHWTNVKKEALASIDSIESSQLKLLRKGVTEGVDKDVVEKYKKATKDMADADRNLKVYDFKPGFGSSKSRETEASAARKKLAEHAVSDENKYNALVIAAMEEGTEKRIAEINAGYDKEIDAIEKKLAEIDELETKARRDGKYTEKDKKNTDAARQTLEDSKTAAGQKRDVGIQNVLKDSKKEIQSLWDGIYDNMRSSLQKGLVEIERSYDEKKNIIIKNTTDATDREMQLRELAANKQREINVATINDERSRLSVRKDIETEKQKLANKTYLFETDKAEALLKIEKKAAEEELVLLKRLQAEIGRAHV